MKVALLLRFLLHTHSKVDASFAPNTKQKYKNFLFAAPENVFQ